MQILTVVVSVACVVLVTMALVTAMFGGICDYRERIARARDIAADVRLRGEISYLARWMCWYFPIVEDFEAFLLDPKGERIDQFRERMFRKYGKREVDGVAAMNGESR